MNDYVEYGFLVKCGQNLDYNKPRNNYGTKESCISGVGYTLVTRSRGIRPTVYKDETPTEFPKGWMYTIIHQLGFAYDGDKLHVVNLASLEGTKFLQSRKKKNDQRTRKYCHPNKQRTRK